MTIRREEQIVFDAQIVAVQNPGLYSLVTAVIPGMDPATGKEEIVFTCHLDHPRPGIKVRNVAGASISRFF